MPRSPSHDHTGSDRDVYADGPLVTEDDIEPLRLEPEGGTLSPGRASLIRALALLCACSLSIGSHYASYILGPLKSRLAREMGTDNTEFSLLISAFSLNSTWTPLVGGVLASRFGTTFASILATGVILLGQTLLLIGNLCNSVRLMALGMFIFGFGVSPLAVVQETIIVRFFKSHGLGVSLALGLLAGKGASFVSARTSYPLSEHFGPHAPFYVATGLAALSFIVNLIYVLASRWLVRSSGTELEASELRAEAHSHKRGVSVYSTSEAEALNEVAKKREVHFRDITKLGDVFWAYIGLNVLCGSIWAPFTHLAANIFERRYELSELDASTKASYVLAGSLLLYPVCGLIVDRLKKHGIVLHLLTISSFLTLLCYLWLVLPPAWTKTPLPAVISFATGHGFSPLLLVVIVPQLVPSKYISTTLGVHKALEQTGSTIFQTLAGVALDIKSKKKSSSESRSNTNGDDKDIQYLLNAFLILNLLQLTAIIGLAYLDERRKRYDARCMALLSPPDDTDNQNDDLPEAQKNGPLSNYNRHGSVHSHHPSSSQLAEQSIPLLREQSEMGSNGSNEYLANSRISPGSRSGSPVRMMRSSGEVRRGEIFAIMAGTSILFAWALFLGTAWMRLRSKEERGHQDLS